MIGDRTKAARALQQSASGPLRGIRVVEFAGIGPGPFAAMMLADMGADVVRIDRPAFSGADRRDIMLRGRRVLAVDLKDDAQRDGVMALTDRADIVLEGYRPGVMERLGLGPEVLIKRNPRLIYGRITGWGQDGPLAQAAGHDINYIALTGALWSIGPKQHPVPPLNLVGDFGGGALYLVVGVLAALIEARASGKGQVVDAAMCDGAASMLAMFFGFLANGRWREGRAANLLDGGAPFYRTYECADGEHVAVGAIEPQFYDTLCRLANLDDPAFGGRDQTANWKDISEKMAAVFRRKSRAEWCAILEGTDACFAPVLSLSEASKHPHMAARQTLAEFDGVVQPAPAPRFSRTPSAIQHSPASAASPLADVVAEWQADSRPGK